jgi:ribosomal protein L14
MLQLKTKLSVSDKSGPSIVKCINTSRLCFSNIITVNINKHSLKYKLSKKSIYLGLCVQNKKWLQTLAGSFKKQHINSCILLHNNLKTITRKLSKCIFKEIFQKIKHHRAIFQTMIMFAKYLVL